jgi:hypothetical protein
MLDLVLSEIRNAIDDDPRQAPSEVHGLVHNEAHDARGEHVVLHVRVPGEPHLFQEIERDIVLGDFFELTPVRVLRVAERVGAGGGVGASEGRGHQWVVW